MDINLYEVLLAAGVAWGALRIEIAYRRWHARRHAHRPRPVPSVGPQRVQGTTVGAAEPKNCSCGHLSRDYVELTSGTLVCLACQREGVES